MKRLFSILSLSLLISAQPAFSMVKTKTKTKTATSSKVDEALANFVVGVAALPFKAVFEVCKLGVKGAVAAVRGIGTLVASAAPEPPKDPIKVQALLRARDVVKAHACINVAKMQACSMAMRHVHKKHPDSVKGGRFARKCAYSRHVREITSAWPVKKTAGKKYLD